ncbi:MAG TPA: mechanosensitive ion channel family protein [Vicinamibacterales bacterium]|nr:mechanosensitive ion channel family protein [Vicinamibacterales bacterium]
MMWGFDMGGWPQSARTAAISLAVIAIAYVLGQVTRFVVVSRLGALARRTPGQWDDAVVAAVGRRVPFWSALVGVYVAAGFWKLAPNFANALDKALYVAAATSLTLLVAEVLVKLVRTHRSAIDPSESTTTLTENLVRIVTVILGLLVILNGLGLSITPMLTALGVGGLAIALALQDTLSNLFAGFYLTVAKQIRIGNYIRLASGEEGYLVDIDWRASRLRQLSNNTVLIPNAKLSQTIVTNYHLPERELAVVLDASVDYGSDLDKVERITTEVGRDVMHNVPGGVSTFEPLVRFHTLGDPGIAFSVTLRAREFVDQYLIKHEFVKRLHRRYAAEGITIPIRSIAPPRQEPPLPPQ